MTQHKESGLHYNDYRLSSKDSIELLATRTVLRNIFDYERAIYTASIDDNKILTVQTSEGIEVFDLNDEDSDTKSKFLNTFIAQGYDQITIYESTRKTYAVLKLSDANRFDLLRLYDDGWRMESKATGEDYDYAIISSPYLYLPGEPKLRSFDYEMESEFFCDVSLLLEEYDDEDLCSFVEKFIISWKRDHKITEVGLS